MKKIILFIAIVASVACSKENVTMPDFDVSVTSESNIAGKPVKFSFKGNPNFISFYSGEEGHEYAYRNRTELTGKPSLNFTTYRQYGSQENSLKLMASTDFKGVYNIAGIQSATWKDLTDRAVLSTGEDNTPSGNIDLSDLAAEGKPVYLAFKKYDANHPTLKPRTWTVRTFNLALTGENNAPYKIADLTTAGWLAVDVLNETYKWSVSTARLYISGGNPNTPENEDWVITKALSLSSVQIAPDPGIPVKGIDSYAGDFEHTFAKAGTYKVAFLASNQTIQGKQSVVKELTVTVVP